MMLN